jgi:hydrogenase/urease accessory protein HupE
MKTTFTRPLAAVVVLLLPVLAQAHPGHDGDHDFGWDFEHLVTHPWATIACVALVLAAGWGFWRLMSSRPVRQKQPLKRD